MVRGGKKRYLEHSFPSYLLGQEYGCVFFKDENGWLDSLSDLRDADLIGHVQVIMSSVKSLVS